MRVNSTFLIKSSTLSIAYSNTDHFFIKRHDVYGYKVTVYHRWTHPDNKDIVMQNKITDMQVAKLIGL